MLDSVQLDTLPISTSRLSQHETITTHVTSQQSSMEPVITQHSTTTQTVLPVEPVPTSAHISATEASNPIQVPMTAYSSTPNSMPSTAPMTSTPPPLVHADSVAIGPSTDEQPIIPGGEAAESVCVITLLLTTGARHPYKLDEKYLTKRNVSVPGLTGVGKKDPFSISVYTLKELILREWREEWEGRPSSPSSIRLIHFGRLLDDKTQLKDCRFNADSPNVVHMTVKPQDVVDYEEAGKSGTRDKSDSERTPGCRCTVM